MAIIPIIVIKIILPPNLYIASTLPDIIPLSTILDIKLGKYKFDNACINNKIINSYVENIYGSEENYIIIFKISNPNIEIYDTRVVEFDIIYNQMEALKIPINSIIKVDKKYGVYVINEQTRSVEFVELKGIEYKDDEFVYINTYKNKVNNIKTVDNYDEIILRPNNINKNIKIR